MAIQIDLSGRVALVTGGGRGVGRGITRRFLDAGAEVVICGRNEPDELPAAGGRKAVFVAADVRDPEACDALVAATTERFGRLDALVNNAGGAPPSDTATASPRFTESILRLNLTSAIFLAQRANAAMQEQESGGSITNITSVSGLRPTPTTAVYGAAKAGLINLTQTLAFEWAPKVRVNSVAAGMIRTEQSHLFYGEGAGMAAVEATVPLGRLGLPEEVGDACVFLASPLASYVSGANLLLHGGGEGPAFIEAVEKSGG